MCVGPGDTIGSIAARYSTDWLQLWGSNFNITEPDALQQGQLLTLGPLYRTRFGDTLSSVAQLFSTTKSSILELNPDVAAVEEVAVDTMLCVQPLVS
jgi:spore germination protein YaaH